MPLAIDLFCGVGGLTKGLELAGIDVIAGLDFDASCQYAYEANNNAVFIHRDITSVTGEELEKLYPHDNDDIHILVGCAPCQPFSKYTQRYRKEEKEKGRQGDNWQQDNKWRLLYSFSNLVQQTHPHIISMENVPELIKEHVFTDFVNNLIEMGYYVNYQIVYCPDYGVPQNRKRLVILASSLGNIELVDPLFAPENYLTVRDAIGELPELASGEVDPNDPIHRATDLSDINLQRIRHSAPGGTWREWPDELILTCHKRSTGHGYGSVYGRMTWESPSPTITTQFYGYGNGRFGHPEQDRAISYREGALLQSFPPDYIFCDPNEPFSRREVGIHIGNAVPVELGRAIGISIMNHIEELAVNGENND